jgi:hypothetical protein
LPSLRGKDNLGKGEGMAFLLDDILLAPIKGIVFIAEKIKEQAEGELLNEEGVRQELRELYQLLEAGQISEEEFGEREEQLVERLEAIEEYKKNKEG